MRISRSAWRRSNGPTANRAIDLFTGCHCEECRWRGPTKQSSHFDKLKAPSQSRGWIAPARFAPLAMTGLGLAIGLFAYG
jgi:hypothetical protein